MKIFSKTDRGRVRDINQDYFACDIIDDETSWIVVCDGMGGYNGGEIASENATNIISEYIKSSLNKSMKGNSIKVLLDSALYGANIGIYDMQNNNPSLKGMGTTVATVIISNEVAYIEHIGDSRVYLYKDKKLMQITKDHSYVQYLLDKGKITPEEAKNSDVKNYITKALGIEESEYGEYDEVKLQKDDIILVCTDGLNNYVEDDEISDVIENNELESVPNLLVDLANKKGGGDNITVVVAKY